MPNPIEIPIAGNWMESVPHTRGVIVFESETPGSPPLLVATTANLRGFAEQRLSATPEVARAPTQSPPPSQRPRADLASITARLLAFSTESSLESDIVYRDVLHSRLRKAYTTASRRWRTWWISIDPDAATPTWSCRPLDTVLQDAAPHRVFGPFTTKETATLAIESIIDVFDLCRDERLLSIAPAAKACVYKEMGRCPAPCDGTELFDSFRARVRDACEFIHTAGNGAWKPRIIAKQREASSRLDFEAAAKWRDALTRADQLIDGPWKLVSSLSVFDWLLAMPSNTRGKPRLLRVRGPHIHPIGTFGTSEAPAALAAINTSPMPTATDSSDLTRASDILGIVHRVLRRGSECTASGIRIQRTPAAGTPLDERAITQLLRPERTRNTSTAPDEDENTESRGDTAP